MATAHPILEYFINKYSATLLHRPGPLPQTVEALLVDKHNLPILIGNNTSARVLSASNAQATAELIVKVKPFM